MNSIRNVAIIAHVDHGKTTLVDALLRQSQTKLGKENEGTELIMDSNELERERGITIFSKNASVVWHDTKINIIDTPGHADFGGEVERVLSLGLRIIVVINKIDKTAANPEQAVNKTFDLFVELKASDKLLDFPIVFASAKQGKAGLDADLSKMADITPLFETVLKEIPTPSGDPAKPLQMLITTLAQDSFKGKIGIGR